MLQCLGLVLPFDQDVGTKTFFKTFIQVDEQRTGAAAAASAAGLMSESKSGDCGRLRPAFNPLMFVVKKILHTGNLQLIRHVLKASTT